MKASSMIKTAVLIAFVGILIAFVGPATLDGLSGMVNDAEDFEDTDTKTYTTEDEKLTYNKDLSYSQNDNNTYNFTQIRDGDKQVNSALTLFDDDNLANHTLSINDSNVTRSSEIELNKLSDIDVDNNLLPMDVEDSTTISYDYLDDTYNVVNFTDPDNPSIISSFNDQGVELEIRNDYLYATNDQGFLVYDISDLSSVTKVAEINSAGDTSHILYGSDGIVLEDNYAYVVTHESDLEDAFVTINISDPTSPTVDGNTTHSSIKGGTGVAVYGKYAITINCDDGVSTLIDKSDKTSPSFVDNATSPNVDGGADISISGDYQYTTFDTSGSNNLAVTNLTDVPNTFQYDKTFKSSHTANPTNHKTTDNYMFVPNYDAGLSVFDIEDKMNPDEVIYKDTNVVNKPSEVAIENNKLYYATDEGKNGVFDITYNERINYTYTGESEDLNNITWEIDILGTTTTTTYTNSTYDMTMTVQHTYTHSESTIDLLSLIPILVAVTILVILAGIVLKVM